ncbi:hypothetical protein HSBAA_43300 [Vreelandella sulfidaeris]|uniref:RapA2 cadherin-like domain-containing protein n=1 Tax=Vreelandella sulfidaeris TaxID=115553 RepID=A0A455UJD2_9GAMM|nr:hypothetical protein HSBAA_43300 [Halomonas sulfidaeris]
MTLTQAGVDAINAGTELPAVNLTAEDSAGLTADDSDTPSYVAQNDGPTIDVTAVDTFNENDAIVGQTVATFTASDEEDGVLTVANGRVDFTAGTNGDGYYAFDDENVTLTQAGVDAINAGTTLPRSVSMPPTAKASPPTTVTPRRTPPKMMARPSTSPRWIPLTKTTPWSARPWPPSPPATKKTVCSPPMPAKSPSPPAATVTATTPLTVRT